MSVETVKAALATLQAQIAGVTRAYEDAPYSLPPSDLPAFVNFAAAAGYDYRAADVEGYVIVTREYRMRLLVAAVQTGIPGEAEALCKPFFTSVPVYFFARPSLGGVSMVQMARIVADGGIQAFPWGQNEAHIGIEFRLQVGEYVSIQYADNE